jgi:two-component system, response regulator PdtaR
MVRGHERCRCHPVGAGRLFRIRTQYRRRREGDLTALRVLVMLAGMGHKVCGIEATEADAVSAAARHRPDLMIVDVQLGDGSGVDAVAEIHRSGPIPHVFVSGNIANVKALQPGAVIIQKPYRESDLARVIQRALDAPSVS